MTSPPPRSTLFPYTTLFRSEPSRFKSGAQVGWHDWAQIVVPPENTVPNAGDQIVDCISQWPRNCCHDTSHHFRSEEHTSELQSLRHLVCRLLLEKKNNRDAH